MGRDVTSAIGTALRTIRDSRGIADGVRALLDYCNEHAPDDAEAWDAATKLDFVADAAVIAEALSDALERRVGPEYTGFYFGLDGLNMPAGKGIEFGCSTAYRRGMTDDEWVYQCSLYPPDIRSEVLSELYRHVSPASAGDYALCLGYLGLALRVAFELMPTTTAAGGADERAIVFGFQSGNLFRLGVVDRERFSLQFEPASEGYLAAAERERTSPRRRAAPSRIETAADEPARTRGQWLARAVRDAADVFDADERARLTEQAMARLHVADADVASEIIATAAALVRDDGHAGGSTLTTSLARALADRGEFETAREILATARDRVRSAGGPIVEILLQLLDHAAGYVEHRAIPPPSPPESGDRTPEFLNDDWPEDRARRQWGEGDREAARETIARALAEQVEAGRTLPNLHHVMSAVRGLLDAQRSMGDRDGFGQSVRFLAWGAGQWDFLNAATGSEVAELLHEVGATAERDRALAVALELAQTDTRYKPFGGVAIAHAKCGDVASALDIAGHCGTAAMRRDATATILARAGRAAEVEPLYRELRSAKARANLALLVVAEWPE